MSTQSPSSSMVRLASRIPKATWDTHMHVVDPRNFPILKTAQYQIAAHTMEDVQAFLDQLGIKKMVIVQPSFYGNDNGCTLDGLKRLGPVHGRAVVQFDPDTTSAEQLRKWHDLGVRGVRLNFKSVGAKLDGVSLANSMHKYADAVRHLGWVLELYIAMEDLPLLEPIVKDLTGVKICIDHFGHPAAKSLSLAKTAHDIPGFTSLVNLLKGGDTWVKISASYRLSKDPNDVLVESICREILRVRPDRLVGATDWPHTRFEGLDISEYLEALLNWIEDEGVSVRQIFVENAEILFDAKT